jgi:hypothetical protein
VSFLIEATRVGGKEALAEKGGVDAVRVVAFAYDTYTNPSKNNGVLGATLTLRLTAATTMPPIGHRFAAEKSGKQDDALRQRLMDTSGQKTMLLGVIHSS